tara:strand:- start:725 stop:1054 length:330 start_codon:yes stop_codon:yes gene_type:complete
MGQPITVVEKTSSREGIIRFEINRSLTGMGHERYLLGQEITGSTPADELARRLFEYSNFNGVHVNANVITIDIGEGKTDGVADVIADLHLYYIEGVEVPTDEEIAAENS